jgi:predicted nucleic acid-binding Zn ribbon protein
MALALDQIRAELEPETVLAEVQRVWPHAVGPVIAREAQPTGERSGVVTVSCSASVWAQELDLMAPAILERLNKLLRSGRVSRLRCVTLPSGT